MRHVFCFGLFAVATTACVSENGQLHPSLLRSDPAQQAGASSDGTTASAPSGSTSSRRDRAGQLAARALAVQSAANDAVRIDGRPQTTSTTSQEVCAGIGVDRTRVAMHGYEDDKSRCEAAAEHAMALADPMAMAGFGGMTNVAAMASMAINLTKPILFAQKGSLAPTADTIALYEWAVPLAEKLAARATEQAQGVSTAMAQRQAQVQAEQDALQAATAACSTAPGRCKARCDGGDGPSCFAWATALWKGTPPKLGEARAAMSKGCDAGTQTACATLPQVDADTQAAAAKADELWGTIADVAQAMLVGGSGYDPGSRRLVFSKPRPGSQQWKATADQCLCPAKRNFVAQAGTTEFGQRAASYCSNPPVDRPFDQATCQNLFATSCSGTPSAQPGWVVRCP